MALVKHILEQNSVMSYDLERYFKVCIELRGPIPDTCLCHFVDRTAFDLKSGERHRLSMSTATRASLRAVVSIAAKIQRLACMCLTTLRGRLQAMLPQYSEDIRHMPSLVPLGYTVQRCGRDGRAIKVRDIVQNILASALNAQEIVKTVVTFDSTGHASSAWGIVSLGLSMIKKDIERRDAILGASEYLAEQLAYFTVLDKGCRYQGRESNGQLEGALVGVYAAMLNYSAEVRRKFDESGVARIGTTLIPLAEQPLQQLRVTVESKAELAEKWASIVDRSLDQKKQAADILTIIDRNVEELQRVHARILTGAEDNRILEWLSQSRYSEAQNHAQDYRAEGTEDWFIESDEYNTGCGKSVMCSTVIDDITQSCHGDPEKQCAYWYFQFNVSESQNVQNMFRCLIRQLHSAPLEEKIKSVWREHGAKESQPSMKALSGVLHSLIVAFRGEICLILDALDECPESPECHERRVLLSLLEELQERHSDKLHILVTSRPEPEISKRLERHATLDLEEKLEDDVANFVRLKVQGLDGRIANQDLKEQIMEELLQIEKRRFRWADLQIKRLEACHTGAMILEALRTIPKTLQDLYVSVIEGIKPSERDFALRPLSLDEVAAAVGLPVPEHTDVIGGDKGIRLAHFSVKEFLIADTDRWYHLSNVSCHRQLAEFAIKALLKQTVKSRTAKPTGVLPYAAEYWPDHLTKTAAGGSDIDLDIMNWQTVYPPPIGEASRLGLICCVNSLLEQGADPLEQYSLSRGFFGASNAVVDAARAGYLDILILLLKNITIPSDTAERTLQLLHVRGSDYLALTDVIKALSDSGEIYDHSTGQEVHIKESIVIAIVGNQESGLELINALFDRHEEKGCATVPITENVVIRCLQNTKSGSGILSLLLEKRSADVQISPRIKELLAASSTISARSMAVLVGAQHEEFVSDTRLFLKFAEGASGEEMESLLKTVGNEESNTSDSSVLEILGCLLDICKASFPMGEAVMLSAINGPSAKQILEMFLCRQQAGFTVTPAVLRAAAQVIRDNDLLPIFEMLMNNGGLGVPITDVVLNAAERETIQALPITDALTALETIFRHRPEIRVTDEMFQPHGHPPIKRMIYQMVKPTFPRDEPPNPYALQVLLQRNPNVPITHRAAVQAAQNSKAFSILLDRRLEDITISPELMLSMMRSGGPLQILQRILEHAGRTMPITEKVLKGAASSPAALKMILQTEGCNVTLSEEVLILATYRRLWALQWLIREHSTPVPLTERMLVAAAANGLAGVQWLLQERPLNADLNWVWRAIWTWDDDFCDFSYGGTLVLDIDTSFFRMKAASNILHYTKAVDISEELFEQLSIASQENKGSLLIDFIHICISYGLPVLMTERMQRLASEKSHAHAIRDLFRQQYFPKDNMGEFEKMLRSLAFAEGEENSSLDE
ncbi:hypothetical protein BO82DRAFT_380369 [Aspergillus uvarum CBS 121591]|uniref:Nephrocystin 3-like N-terminal domain-containing protein n=1 Tax=Aspergillus uvarum CBS 121591 TaxID=1448315 RepID=A0A319CQ24_9EURO|nr:hypothetical protein BO82DRAFT_380369 [Aspergillus uvarum CBS 121591]PYH86231.1 hypothetical protein BO82DRAFT_380369 [Aspergillus uvarum CBS 121591]